MKDFVVSLDVSALDKYESESEPYNLLVDTGKLNTVQDFIFWFKHLFSINDPVVLLHGETEVDIEEEIQVLSSKNKLIVKPSTSVSDSKTTTETPLAEDKCTKTPESPAKGESTASDSGNRKAISAVAPKNDKQTDTSEMKTSKASNSKKTRDRLVLVSCSLYENGKLRNIVKEIDVENPSTYPVIESKDMFYRCYSKSLKSLEKHTVLPEPPPELNCNNMKGKKNTVNEVQSSSDKKVSEGSVETSNGSPKKNKNKKTQNSLTPEKKCNHSDETYQKS